MFLLVLVLLLQQAAASSINLMEGVVVSADEAVQIGRLAQGAGTPWLATRRPGMLAGIVWVILRPDTSTPRIRRGRYLEMCAWKCNETPRRIGNGPYEWHFDPSWPESIGRYAQIVAPGRDPENLRAVGDPNRPFVVVGDFSDDELVSLVEFIRSSPGVAAGNIEKRVPFVVTNADVVQGTMPISRIVGGQPQPGGSTSEDALGRTCVDMRQPSADRGVL
jgi:hypothetical protein